MYASEQSQQEIPEGEGRLGTQRKRCRGKVNKSGDGLAQFSNNNNVLETKRIIESHSFLPKPTSHL